MSSCGTRKRRGGGSIQQSLDYNLPGSPLPYSEVQQTYLPIDKDPNVIRPAIGPLLGGGSVGQSLDYVIPNYPVPNAPGGQTYLNSGNPLVVRPQIGGFMPSVMKGVVNAGVYTIPAAFVMGRRLLEDKKVGRGGGKRSKANWERVRTMARDELLKYGSPAAINTNKYASLLESNPEAAHYFLEEYKCRKGTSTKKTRKVKPKKNTLNLIREEAVITPSTVTMPMTMSRNMPMTMPMTMPTIPYTMTEVMPIDTTRRNKLKANRNTARNILSKYGKPNASHLARAVTMLRNKKPVEEIVADFQRAKTLPRVRKINTTRRNNKLTTNELNLIRLASAPMGV